MRVPGCSDSVAAVIELVAPQEDPAVFLVRAATDSGRQPVNNPGWISVQAQLASGISTESRKPNLQFARVTSRRASEPTGRSLPLRPWMSLTLSRAASRCSASMSQTATQSANLIAAGPGPSAAARADRSQNGTLIRTVLGPGARRTGEPVRQSRAGICRGAGLEKIASIPSILAHQNKISNDWFDPRSQMSQGRDSSVGRLTSGCRSSSWL